MQLLEKTIVEKLDNEEYLTKEDNGTRCNFSEGIPIGIRYIFIGVVLAIIHQQVSAI